MTRMGEVTVRQDLYFVRRWFVWTVDGKPCNDTGSYATLEAVQKTYPNHKIVVDPEPAFDYAE